MGHMNYGKLGDSLPDPCESEGRVRYDVAITGHEAPFKWEVERWLPGASVSTLPTSDCRGEAASYEEAMFAAAEAAREAEWSRMHAATKRTEALFDCPLKVDLGSHLGPNEGPTAPEPQ